jgi:hypothetical protein
MNLRSLTHLLLPTLALGLTLTAATAVQASGTSATLQISFGSAPHWVGVTGTKVRAIRSSDRTDYDMFQYNRNYYAYNQNNARWYMSRRSRGQFRLVDDRYVPSELRRVPRDHWRNYPAAWQDRDSRGPGGTSAFLQISFGSTPHWARAGGTQVEYVPYADGPNYDVFHYGSTYYAYSSNRWYSSPRESGNFTAIDDRSVPSELSKVPRDHWRNYPAAWGNQQDKSPSNGNSQGKSGGRGAKGRGNGHN